MPNKVTVKGKTYKLPIFLPDATRCLVKTIDSQDIKNSGIEGIVVNTYHLLTYPGISVLDKFGGVKNFMNFDGLVVTDSGGWQIFSLIHRDKKAGSITDRGVTFSVGGGKKELFTPEKVIQTQFKINSDIMICLDDFTDPVATEKEVGVSVGRTILWAKRCKDEYNKIVKAKKLNDKTRPLLFAVIQGASSKKMRERCAKGLVEIGFDGYGFGGYLVNKETGELDLEMMDYLASLIPEDSVRFALGTGKPKDIAACAEMGWHIFDCTLPTRDARHKRLYVFNKEPKNLKDLKNPKTHGYMYVKRRVFSRDQKPVSKFCDCYTCKNYSRAYLNHLFNLGDPLAHRLATIHNLRVYSKLTDLLRKFIQ
jgi:queuine tRNA-ribosyltransferase